MTNVSMAAPEQARILVVEDSRTQAARLRGDLQAAGYETAVASSGEEALALASQSAFDLVLSDVVMPGMDGYELCHRIRSDPALAPLPVVLLTSLADPFEVVRALEVGADNFLRKPYERDQLLERVDHLLRSPRSAPHGEDGREVEVRFRERRFVVTAGRRQMLELLLTTFADLVASNDALRRREEELSRAHTALAAQFRTAETERERLRSVVAAVPDALVIVDERGRIADANRAASDIAGVPRADLMGRAPDEVFVLLAHDGRPVEPARHPLHLALTTGRAADMGLAFDTYLQQRDGTRSPVVLRAAPVRDGDGNVISAVGLLSEVGQLAEHDAQTGLPSESVFAREVEWAAMQAVREGTSAAVLLVRIPRLAALISTLPPGAGDELVARIARRIRSSLAVARPGAATCSVAYLRSGELAALVPGVAGEVEAARLGARIVEEFRSPTVVEDLELTLAASVGISLAARSGEDVVALVSRARAAVERATAKGDGVVELFDSSMQVRAVHQLSLEAELRQALETGELRVHYQPQVRAGSGAPVAVEALVRWDHPKRGLIAADEFIPLAEESGLVVPLGELVLREACRQAVSWRRSELPGASELVVAVNLSARQLAQPDLSCVVARVLAESGLPPSALQLEITETAMAGEGVDAIRAVQALRNLGVELAIDDFGTGYSSLLYLRDLPVDVLKIDRSFVSRMAGEPHDAAIVAGVVRMGHALGLAVVAEGVEDVDQLMQLRLLGCDFAQGYLFGRPCPAEGLTEWWARAPLPYSTNGGGSAAGALSFEQEQLEETLGYLAHELRSPLAAILGFTELLSDTDDPAERDEFAQAVVRNARELELRLRTVSDAHAVTRGMMQLEVESVDVGALVRTLVDDLRSLLDPHPLHVAAGAGPARTLADPARLRQALTNLLTNAAKFSPSTAPIEVNVAVDGGNVEVLVRDRGHGVPEERRPELFRKFSRLGSRRKGMGIGLHLARAVARAHGGDVTYAPAPDVGSCFTLTLPCAPYTS